MRLPWRRHERPASPAPVQEPLAPLSLDRVRAVLERRGFRVAVDEDGDLTGLWDDFRFWFLVDLERYERLEVRGAWHRPRNDETVGAVRLACNDWNRERLWPKAYWRLEDERLVVYAEHAITLPPGITDSQIDQTVLCALSTGVQLFRELDSAIPRPVPD